MISMIQEFTGTKLVVGQNGRVWLDGPEEGLRRARACLRIIAEEGHRSGLTERVRGFLASTGETDDIGPKPLHPRFDSERPASRSAEAEASLPEGGPHRSDLTDGIAPPPEPEEEPPEFSQEEE